MNVRRVAVAAIAAFGLLGTTQAGAAGTFSMDGKRVKTKTWDGRLDEVAVPANSTTRADLNPGVDDCTSARSCDVKELRLSLPKGTSKGRLVVSVRVGVPLAAFVGLYDAKGELLDYADVLDCCPFPELDNPYEYVLQIVDDRLSAGRYTLAIIDRAGSGPYEGRVDWTAHPPDRRKR